MEQRQQSGLRKNPNLKLCFLNVLSKLSLLKNLSFFRKIWFLNIVQKTYLLFTKDLEIQIFELQTLFESNSNI